MTPAVLSSTLVVLAVLEALAELFDELLADCSRLELDCFVDELFFCVLDCVVDELLDDAELVELELPHPANMMPPSRIVA